MLDVLGVILGILDVLSFVADVVMLVVSALDDPLRSLIWLLSAGAAVGAMIAWSGHGAHWLGATLALGAVGTCALAIWLPALRRRRRVTEV